MVKRYLPAVIFEVSLEKAIPEHRQHDVISVNVGDEKAQYSPVPAT